MLRVLRSSRRGNRLRGLGWPGYARNCLTLDLALRDSQAGLAGDERALPLGARGGRCQVLLAVTTGAL